MRYVRIGDEPGVRRDLLTGRDVYSSRFLNAEEHFTEALYMRVWVALIGLMVCTARWTRRELKIRWEVLTVAEMFFVSLGIIMLVLFIFFLSTTL